MARNRKKAGIFLLTASVLAVTAAGVTQVQTAQATDTTLADNGTAAPESWGATPSLNQYRYQKDELAAFCHFGPNTFNNVEWGESYGTKDPDEIFKLSNDFDAETLVSTLKEAGFKKLIVTAKHHDGFCIWASDYTTYDIASTSYKNGQGDILAEISAACTKYDLDMGLYLSPWDIHEESYGYYDADGNATTEENDVLDYNEYYNNQLEEILGNDKYGNNGHFVEVWMDGAKGSGANAQDYDFETWFATIQKYEGIAGGYDDDCLLFGAGAYTTVRWIGNENGLANEETWSKSTVNYETNSINNNNVGGYTAGLAEGNKWTVPECDARITSGWFWGSSKCTPKSISDLANMYFSSVGHNATLLLNIPPNDQGTIDEAILNRVKEFGENIKETFETNLAENATVTATEVRGNDIAYAPENVLDGDDDTYWTMEDGSTTGSLTIDLGGTKTFDVVSIEEAIQLGQRIKSFTVEYKSGDGDWKTFSSGTTIGAKRLCRENAVKADKIRINITGSYAVPLISEVGVYKASEDFSVGSAIPDGLEQIAVTDTDTSDGAGFTYTSGNGTTGWKSESGTSFISGNGIWANTGNTLTLTFTGTKVWLYGTKDPSHGTADIYIDGEKVASINTTTTTRALGQLLFTSDDLSDGSHTLEVRNTGTIGLDTAAVLNNGGKGMIQFESTSIEMEEDSVQEVVVKRVGGSKGEVRVIYENNPGSAVQGNYDTDGIAGTLVFKDGETEKTIKVTTKRDDFVKGDLDFTVDLISAEDGAVLGSQTSLKVTIHDLDDPSRIDEAKTILSEAQTLLKNASSTEGLDEIRELTKELKAYLAASEKSDAIATCDIVATALKLQAAKEGVSTTFSFPTGTDTKTIEAEAFTLDASGAADANKYVRIQDNSSASGGKEVNWFENGNKIILPFYAAKAGTYKVTATYRSGRDSSNPNALVWSGTHIQAGETTVYGESGAGTYHTVELTIQVTEAGDGELIFTADSRGGPVLDKFTIQAVNQTAAEKVKVTGITLKQDTMELTKEQPYGLIFENVLPANADNTEVTYTSEDPSVATVDENGLVMAVANGETVITVTTVDGQKTATCKVTVQMTTASEDNTQETDKPSDNKPSDNTTTDSKPETPSTGANTGSGTGTGTGTGNGTGTGTGTGSSTETPVVKGTTYSDPNGIYTYKVTDVEKRTVEVVKVNAAGKNKKSLKIFNTVTIGGQSYKVTSIGASLFKGNTKITSIIIGKNVTTIGKKAFYGCKNLKKITVKSKVLTKVGAKALKGTNKKLTIKVPKAKKKAYTKLLAKKGQAGTAKIK